MMHFTPDVFFIVLYAVLIAFWATLYYEKPREFERLTIVFWLVALCVRAACTFGLSLQAANAHFVA